jgi:hypothetical protein
MHKGHQKMALVLSAPSLFCCVDVQIGALAIHRMNQGSVVWHRSLPGAADAQQQRHILLHQRIFATALTFLAVVMAHKSPSCFTCQPWHGRLILIVNSLTNCF